MSGHSLIPAVDAAERLPHGKSLGERSRKLKRRDMLRRVRRAAIASAAIWTAAMILGFAFDGIGIEGLIATFFVMAVAIAGFIVFPLMRAPRPEELRGSSLAKLAGRAEIFLEAQRPLLPAPAQGLIDEIGHDLDQLAPQLKTLREREPAAHEVKRLLGEHLPGLIESYTRIPDELRREPHAGSTPEAQLVSGLGVISNEIRTMTGQIARGELDALATRGRYLETKYVTAPADGTNA